MEVEHLVDGLILFLGFVVFVAATVGTSQFFGSRLVSLSRNATPSVIHFGDGASFS